MSIVLKSSEFHFRVFVFRPGPGLLDMTLKGIRGVKLDNRKVLCAPDPWTKYLNVFFCRSVNYL